MQKSLEVEYWTIDEHGALTEPGDLLNTSEWVVKEFVDCLLELKTPPCETIAELRTSFLELLDETLSRADEFGKQLVPLGTPINTKSIEMRNDERSELQRAVVGSDFDYARHCAGTHMHFEQRNVVDQLNTLIALDPALALCNSSPYYQGDRIADSARVFLYRKKCYEQLPKHGQLWEYAETVAQWDRRLDRRYEEFLEIAQEKGIDSARIAEHFSADDVVWTPVRLRDEMPTVEWRSPDTTLPSELLRLVEAVEAIMEHLHQTNVTVAGDTCQLTSDEIVLPEFESLCDYAEAAMVDGVASQAVTEYLTQFGFNVEEYSPLSRELDGHDHISLEGARRLRLQYADRLRQDVDSLLQTSEA